ncbi:MAG TPA: hypothetical protein V6C65_37030, partial [Allocoleopsis sp.]
SNMGESITMAQYAADLTPPKPAQEEAVVAPLTVVEQFMYSVLHPERFGVQRVTWDEYDRVQDQLTPGMLLAYLWMSSSSAEPTFMQYSVIATRYGRIYIACRLDEDGELYSNQPPLEVYYDSSSLKQIVEAFAHDKQALFHNSESVSVDFIYTEQQLKFFFGLTAYGEDHINLGHVL